MDEDFAVSCPLVRPGLPDIRFLFVRSRFCSTLLSDVTSRRRPCASLALHLHQVVQGTCTPKRSNMLGTQLSRFAVGIHPLVFQSLLGPPSAALGLPSAPGPRLPTRFPLPDPPLAPTWPPALDPSGPDLFPLGPGTLRPASHHGPLADPSRPLPRSAY